jgi:hypothetical protein
MKSLISKVSVRTGAAATTVAGLLLAKAASAQVNTPGVENIPNLARGTFSSIIVDVLRWGLGIAGSVAVLMLIIGGFLYITSSGDEGRLEKAKNTIKNAIIGVIVILLAFVIVETINAALITGAF